MHAAIDFCEEEEIHIETNILALTTHGKKGGRERELINANVENDRFWNWTALKC